MRCAPRSARVSSPTFGPWETPRAADHVIAWDEWAELGSCFRAAVSWCHRRVPIPASTLLQTPDRRALGIASHTARNMLLLHGLARFPLIRKRPSADPLALAGRTPASRGGVMRSRIWITSIALSAVAS